MQSLLHVSYSFSIISRLYLLAILTLLRTHSENRTAPSVLKNYHSKQSILVEQDATFLGLFSYFTKLLKCSLIT